MTVNYDDVADTLIAKGKAPFGSGLLRFTIGTDEHTTLDDYDCYGKVAPVTYNRDLGIPNERPAHFNGLAQIITTVFGDRFWWQPTPEQWGLTNAEWVAQPENIAKNREVVQDVLSFGFKTYTVEYCDGVDAYNRPIVRGVASVSAVEPFTSDDDTSYMLVDLIHEALINGGVLV